MSNPVIRENKLEVLVICSNVVLLKSVVVYEFKDFDRL